MPTSTPLPILQGTLDMLVLKALAFGPQHGYGITACIRLRTEGDLDVEDGALYQALHRLAHKAATRAPSFESSTRLRAERTPMLRLVIRQALGLALAGVVFGLIGALWMGGVLTELLYETTPTDPVALGTVAVLLLVIAVAASIVPARRATRIQPVDALREI